MHAGKTHLLSLFNDRGHLNHLALLIQSPFNVNEDCEKYLNMCLKAMNNESFKERDI